MFGVHPTSMNTPSTSMFWSPLTLRCYRNPLEIRVSGKRSDTGVKVDGDIFYSLQFFEVLRVRLDRAADNQAHRCGDPAHLDRSLYPGIAATDHRDLFSLVKRTIAGRADGQAAAQVFLLVLHPEFPVLFSLCQDHAPCF